MALINCSECDHQVSDKAAVCPKCGAPIATASETNAAGTQINTIQQTSKKFKLQTLLSISLIIIGVIWMVSVPIKPPYEPSPIPGLLAFTGLIWYVINRVRIWWHHK